MQNLGKLTRRKLGEILETEGLVTQQQIEKAIAIQKSNGKLLGEILVELGFVSEEAITKCIVSQYNLPYIEASRYAVSRDVFNLFKKEDLQKYAFVPLDKIDNCIIIALYGQVLENELRELERTLNCQLYLFVTTPTEAKRVFQKMFNK